MAKFCNCGLCKPEPGKRYDPEHGYDLDAVAAVECLICKEPIGTEDYYEFIAWARFGQMFFIHERCRPVADDKGE